MDRNYRELLTRVFTGAILIASIGALAACGGGGGGGSTPPASGSVVWSKASDPSPIDDQSFATAITGTSIIVAGYDSTVPVGDDEWRIEKRNLSDGALVASFGTTTGTIVSNPSYSDINSSDKAYAVAVDSEAMYVAGYDSILSNVYIAWHIEKRDLVTGASVTAFNSTGIISEDISIFDDAAFAVAVDPSPTGMLYVVGYEGGTASNDTEWRIEARNKDTAALVSWVTSSPGLSLEGDAANAIAIDPGEGYMYVVGTDFSSLNGGWRIEKRTLSAPLSLETSTFGAPNGFIHEDPSTGLDEPLAIALDATHMYIAGYEYDTAINKLRWRIEKRKRTDGSLDVSFGSGGIVKSNTTTNAVASTIAIDSNYLYVAGYDNTTVGNLEWRIEKRSLATGALVTSFGSGGVVVNDFGTPLLNDSIRAISVDANYIYVAGYENVGTNNDSRWRIMKLVK